MLKITILQLLLIPWQLYALARARLRQRCSCAPHTVAHVTPRSHRHHGAMAVVPQLLLSLLAIGGATASIELPGVRAPAYPLFVHSPYTSWWSPARLCVIKKTILRSCKPALALPRPAAALTGALALQRHYSDCSSHCNPTHVNTPHCHGIVH